MSNFWSIELCGILAYLVDDTHHKILSHHLICLHILEFSSAWYWAMMKLGLQLNYLLTVIPS